mmetsp:Transcript_16997/g.42546  ORF Transcript_16997/g.42546 Transcript_16997/m.42546 type:complete len:113 (+) Transcript_16997:416-754(+)
MYMPSGSIIPHALLSLPNPASARPLQASAHPYLHYRSQIQHVQAMYGGAAGLGILCSPLSSSLPPGHSPASDPTVSVLPPKPLDTATAGAAALPLPPAPPAPGVVATTAAAE